MRGRVILWITMRDFPRLALSEYSLSERVGLFAAAGGLRNVRPVFDIFLNVFKQESMTVLHIAPRLSCFLFKHI